MRDITFGQYYPVDSVVHRIDPRVKILLTIFYITSVFYAASFAGFAFVGIFLIFLVAVSRVPFKTIFKSLRGILFLVLFTSLLNLFFLSGDIVIFKIWKIVIYKESVVFAGLMSLRLIFLVLGPSLLTLTTTPVELTEGIERLLAPFKLIRLPVHELALIMSIALRFIPTLIEETDRIIKAQKARCADFESGNIIKRARALLPILIPLFVSAFRRADELALAMDSRCYNGSRGRTKMKVLKIKYADVTAVLIFIIFFCAILIIRQVI